MLNSAIISSDETAVCIKVNVETKWNICIQFHTSIHIFIKHLTQLSLLTIVFAIIFIPDWYIVSLVVSIFKDSGMNNAISQPQLFNCPSLHAKHMLKKHCCICSY